MTSRDSQICQKILSEIAVAGQLMEGISVEDFINDERTARAVSMTLINIGELVKNLTPELKEANPNSFAICWRAGNSDPLTLIHKPPLLTNRHRKERRFVFSSW